MKHSNIFTIFVLDCQIGCWLIKRGEEGGGEGVVIYGDYRVSYGVCRLWDAHNID